MSTEKPKLDAAFIARQRQYLLRLRTTLRGAVQSTELEETEVESDSTDTAQDLEDDAQKLTALELDGNLVARHSKRLELVDRALKKIDDGTYGFSDISGLPISRERLEAVPEAIYTLGEEQNLEKKR